MEDERPKIIVNLRLWLRRHLESLALPGLEQFEVEVRAKGCGDLAFDLADDFEWILNTIRLYGADKLYPVATFERLVRLEVAVAELSRNPDTANLEAVIHHIAWDAIRLEARVLLTDPAVKKEMDEIDVQAAMGWL